MNVNEKISIIYKGSQIIDSVIKNSKTIYSMLKTLQGIPPFNFRSIGNKVIDYKIYGNTKQQLLPNEYQQVEYIQTTGSQYIDTNYYLQNNNLNIKTKIETNDMPGNEQDLLSNQDNSTNRFVLGLYNKRIFGYHRGSSTPENVVSNQFTGKNIFEIDMNYNFDGNIKELIVNGEKYSKTMNNIGISNNNTTIKLFTNGNDVLHNDFIGKCYYMQLYVDKVLTFDLIPCYRKNDNEIGLYDLVSNTFFTNAGTGTFLKGNNAPTSTAPIDVLAVGDLQNLFDINNITANRYIFVDGGTGYSTLTNISNYFEVHANKKIIIEFEYNTVAASGNRSYCFYDTNKNVVSGGENYNSPTKKLEITPNIDGFMRIAYDINTEKVTIYEEGKKYKIPLNLKGYNTLNLPNKTITSNGVTISSSNQKISANGTINNSSWCVTEDIPLNIKAGETVFVKYNDPQTIDYQVIFRFIYESDTYDYVDKTVKSTRKEFNFVATKNITKLALFFGGDLGETLNINNATIMISTKDVPYKPYEDTNIYLNEPLRKINNYQDYVDFETGKVHRKIWEENLSDTKYFNHYNKSSSYNGSYWLSSGNDNLGDKKRLRGSIYYCNYFSHVEDVTNFKKGTCFTGDGAFNLWLGDGNNYTTLESFKTWLSQNNVVADYILEDEIVEDIELPEILTVKGNNTLDVDTTVLPSNMIINYK